jgi:hypothetical protein
MREFFTILTISLCLAGAVAQSTAPVGFGLHPVLPAGALPASTHSATVASSAIEENGRFISLREIKLEGRATARLAGGATLRQTRAHGRAVQNRYTADGWRLWGAWQVRQPDAGPGVLVVADYIRDSADLQVVTANSSFFASADVSAVSGQAAVLVARGAGSGHLRGGLATTTLFGDRLATVWLLGAGWEQPVGTRFVAETAVTAFMDDFQGRHYDLEAALGLRYAVAPHTTLSLTGRYYPRGIPLAGAPLGPAAAVGAFYGDSATDPLRNDAFGMVTLSAAYAF